MTLSCLRSDLPAATTFTVTETGAAALAAKLDQNEAPVDLPAELKRELTAELRACAWNRYPQPSEYAAAKRRFAAALGLDPDRVALVAGGDQAIQAAFLVGGGPGRRARWFEPAYPYIPLMSRVTGTLGEGVILGADLDDVLDTSHVTATPSPHLVCLVSPNNPTGGLAPRRVVEAALADAQKLVLVDEAYHDFSGESVLGDFAARDNLVVARSLSKALLAGVRLGYAVAHPEVVALIERIYTAPYHLNHLHLVVAARWADILPHARAQAAAVMRERDRLAVELATLPGVSPRPSRANFILFQVPEAARVHAALAAAGVRVRLCSAFPGLGDHLRVTAGTPAQNHAFLSALRAALAAPPG